MNDVPVDKSDADIPDYTVCNQAGKGTVVGDKDVPLSSSMDPASVSLADADCIVRHDGVILVHRNVIQHVADVSDRRTRTSASPISNIVDQGTDHGPVHAWSVGAL